MITTRSLRESDSDFVTQLTDQEKWGHLPCDIKRCLAYEPEGCFMAEVDGKQAGHVFSISYGKLGWIGLVIVKALYRRQGIATMLTQKAIDYLAHRGVETIKLEAVAEVANLYRKLGFADEYHSIRFARIGKIAVNLPSQRLQPMKEEELEEIAEFDAQYFGANRLKVLEGLFRDYPGYCFVSKRTNRVAGYIMARKTTRGFWLGPWVCDPQHLNTAAKLLSICMVSLGGNDVELRIGTPSVNANAVQILQSLKFNEVSKSIRMFHGKQDSVGNLGVYGIGAPETG